MAACYKVFQYTSLILIKKYHPVVILIRTLLAFLLIDAISVIIIIIVIYHLCYCSSASRAHS